MFLAIQENALSYSSSVVPDQSVNGENGLQGKSSRNQIGKTSALQWSKKAVICSTVGWCISLLADVRVG